MLRFAVHRGHNDSLSVRGHRPSGGQNVQSGVHVSVGDMPAGDRGLLQWAGAYLSFQRSVRLITEQRPGDL